MKPIRLLLILAALTAISNGAVAQLQIDGFGNNQAGDTEISAAGAIGGVRHLAPLGQDTGFATILSEVSEGNWKCAAGLEFPLGQPLGVNCTATYDGSNDGTPSFASGALGSGSPGGGIDLATGAAGIEVVVSASSGSQVEFRALNYDGSQCTLTSEQFIGATTLVLPFDTTGCLDANGQRPTDVRAIAIDVAAAGIDAAGIWIDRIRLIPLPSYPVGGTLSGLAPGSTVILQNNGGDDLVLDTDGGFTFATEVFDQGDYEVTVATQPSDPVQLCTVNNGMGQVDGAPVTTVDVQCEAAFSIGGTVSGLRTPGLILDLNNQSALLFEQDGAYTFPLGVANGADYTVTTLVSPADHVCMVTDGGGTVAGANVTNADVTCTTNILFADSLETLSADPIVLD